MQFWDLDFPKTPENAAWGDAYKAKYGKNALPSLISIAAYDGMKVVFEMIKATDGKRDGVPNLPPASLAGLPQGESLPTNGCLLIGEKAVLFSPVFGRLEPSELARWILESGLTVRLQLQAHKFIWSPEIRGV